MKELEELAAKLDRLVDELEDHLKKHPGKSGAADGLSLLIYVTALRLMELDRVAA